MTDEDKLLRRLALEHSRPARWDRTTSDPDGMTAIDHLMALLVAGETRARARRKDDLARLRATMAALALDLFVCAKADPTRYLAYPRDNNAFKPSRYANPTITATNVVTVADFLLAAGFAEGATGYQNRTEAPFGGKAVAIGRRSRIRATAKLVDLFEHHSLAPRGVGFVPEAEVVRLKGAPAGRRQAKPLMEYDDTDTTNAMREGLGRINALLGETRIDLEGDPADDPQDAQESPSGHDDTLDFDDRPDAADRSAVRLHRVFNNGSFTDGGRFYGGWWMALPKQDRARLLIEGEPTVELDFRSLHARLCYQLEGQPLAADVDPYTLPAMPDAPRDQVKAAVNRLLNGAPGKIPKAPAGIDRTSWRATIAAVERHHKPIAGWLRSGRGMRLQHFDSAIASTVLDSLAYRSIPCLPIHDSFIVAESCERVLGETMYHAYRGQAERFGAAKVWPVISGWSSAQVEEQVTEGVDRTG